jgi:hypothetical protein
LFNIDEFEVLAFSAGANGNAVIDHGANNVIDCFAYACHASMVAID